MDYMDSGTHILAGFIISLIDIILILFLFAVIAAAFGIAGASTALYTML